MKEPRIYITAYNCSPGRVSDHASGWNHINEISKLVPVTVITDKKYEDDFIRGKHLLGTSLRVEFVKSIIDLTFLNTISFPWGFYLSYRFWEKAVYKYLLKKFREGEVVLIHRLTLGSLKEPGYCWKIPVPYIWSQAHVPSYIQLRFFRLFSASSAFVLLMLNITRFYLSTFHRRCRRAIANSDYIFTTNLDSKLFIERHFNRRSEVCYEVGCNPSFEMDPTVRHEKEPFQIVWAGRIVDYKGIELILRALAKLKQGINYRFLVAGEGKDRVRLSRIASELGVHAEFLGMVPHENIPVLLRQSHCLIYASFHDGVTNLVFEAMSNGCPIICLDHLSYSEVVNEKIGIKVSVTNIEQIIADLAVAVERLYGDEQLRQGMIMNIRSEIVKYAWSFNAQKIVSAYEKVLGERAELREVVVV